MVSRSIRIRHLIASLLFILASTSAFDADTQLPFDSRRLVEVHSLDAIPKDVISLLGWHRGGPDGIADRFDKFNVSGAAGSSSKFHGIGYTMTGSGWRKAGEWDVDDESTDLQMFLYEVDSARYGQRARLYLENRREYRVLARIERTRPFHRTAPLRKSNLSDEEAREIQSVMSQVYPGALLNISEVVAGCYCEEGRSCSDQVWVVPRDDVQTPGVLLSRIDDRWVIGPIQRWWLNRAKLETDSALTRSQREEALYTQWKTFPECSKPPVTGSGGSGR